MQATCPPKQQVTCLRSRWDFGEEEGNSSREWNPKRTPRTKTRGVVERMLRCKTSKAKQIPHVEEVLAKSLYSRHLALLASLRETRTPVLACVLHEIN